MNLANKIYSKEFEQALLSIIKNRNRYVGEYLDCLKNTQKKEEKAKYLVMIAYKIRRI